MKAIEQGVAKFNDVTFEQEYETAKRIIMRARGMVQECHGDRLYCDAAGQSGPQADRNGDRAQSPRPGERHYTNKETTMYDLIILGGGRPV